MVDAKLYEKDNLLSEKQDMLRAAMTIQVMLHEIGCLPVSKLCGIGYVSEVLNVDGTSKDPEDRM